MKKVALIFAALLLLLPLMVSAQVIVDDDFSTLGEWVPGYGEWGIRGGMLVQRDTDTGLARIDRMVAPPGVVPSGEFEIAFKVRYEAGGFESQAALLAQQLHGGFGIHVGVENPPLGRVAWGAGNSYLLWLNLDTRVETAMDAREHLGFRAQVYESVKNSEMDLAPGSNIDIIAALNAAGIPAPREGKTHRSSPGWGATPIRAIIKNPMAVYVERVYEDGAFSALGPDYSGGQ